MKLITAYGYFPRTQKPVDHQPYRPTFMFHGPPPDAGFSYGLFEDATTGKQFYADLGLESFSPMSGGFAKQIDEFTSYELQRILGDDLLPENLSEVTCPSCGASYFSNTSATWRGRDTTFCHRCGGLLGEKSSDEDAATKATKK